jgi:hypothetical protein
MPTNKSPKQFSLLQLTTTDPDALPEYTEIVMRFKRFAVGDKNYFKALERLMDLADVA